MLQYFLLGLALGFPAAAQPGPFQAFLLSQTLRRGWRPMLPAALAPLISDGPIIALVLLILSQTPPLLLQLVRLTGGFYMLFLAWNAWRMVDAPPLGPEAAPTGQTLRAAVLLNLLNPNPYIFWATVAGPIIVDAWRQSPDRAVGFGVGFYGTLIGGLAALIVLFAAAGRLDPRLNRGLRMASAAALLLFGLYQFYLAWG